MGQPGRDLRLAQEALATQRGRQLRPQHLERHWAVELAVVGEVHHCHPTTTQLALDRVAVAESAAKLLEDVRHAPNPGDRVRPQ
jgi:hypothetical protein